MRSPDPFSTFFETLLCGSFTSPNVIASAGQATAHAGFTSPSLTGRFRPSPLPYILDALYAEGTLLHHAARPHRDLGVEDQPGRVFDEGRVVEEVESPDLERAVVRAITVPTQRLYAICSARRDCAL